MGSVPGGRLTKWWHRRSGLWPKDSRGSLELEKFFDRVDHDKLMGQIAKRVADKRLLKLIRAFLNAEPCP